MKVLDLKPKQQYHPPRLHIYGDLAQLTRTTSNMGSNDGGSGKSHKTGAG
jgi:hypothetical protein